jgi:hypothetical protein
MRRQTLFVMKTREEIVALEDGVRENEFDEAFNSLTEDLTTFGGQALGKLQSVQDSELAKEAKNSYFNKDFF